MDWADIFERADAHRTDVETIRETLAARRGETTRPDGATRSDGESDGEVNGDV